MSLIAVVSVPRGDVLVGDLLPPDDGVRVDLVEMVPAGEGRVPYVRVTAGESSLRRFERAAGADPRVAGLSTVDVEAGSTLYRIEWAAPPGDFLESCIADGIVVESAVWTVRDWQFRLLVPGHDALASFYRRCRDSGITTTLLRVYDRDHGDERDRFGWGLTGPQREAIVLARRRGYFDVPREVTLSELAGELGISHQAMSGRLRRGLESLLDSTLMADLDATSGEPL